MLKPRNKKKAGVVWVQDLKVNQAGDRSRSINQRRTKGACALSFHLRLVSSLSDLVFHCVSSLARSGPSGQEGGWIPTTESKARHAHHVDRGAHLFVHTSHRSDKFRGGNDEVSCDKSRNGFVGVLMQFPYSGSRDQGMASFRWCFSPGSHGFAFIR